MRPAVTLRGGYRKYMSTACITLLYGRCKCRKKVQAGPLQLSESSLFCRVCSYACALTRPKSVPFSS